LAKIKKKIDLIFRLVSNLFKGMHAGFLTGAYTTKKFTPVNITTVSKLVCLSDIGGKALAYLSRALTRNIKLGIK
jgi:hypothetical protein